MLPAIAGLHCSDGLRRYGLLTGDGAGRAGVGASAAVDTDVGIDGVHIAFRDGAGRAFTLAGSTSDAGLRIDFVCHNSYKVWYSCSVSQKPCKYTLPLRENKTNSSWPHSCDCENITTFVPDMEKRNTVAITLAVVTLQSWRAANANPVDSLKNE